jgi:hypothetical protein
MCEREQELRNAATAVLDRIDALTDEQIAAIKGRDDEALMAIDKQLELAFGEKERAFGTLLSHRKEHGC